MNCAKCQLIAAMTIFSTIGLVRRYIPYSSTLIAFARAFIGVIFLLGVLKLKSGRFDMKGIKRYAMPLVISGVFMGINWILLFESYNYTTVSVSTICYYMAPVFVIFASRIVFKETITLKKGLCALIAVVGMVFVSGVLETGFIGMQGALYGLGAAVFYASVIVINKYNEAVPPIERTLIQLGVAAAAILPYLIVTEDLTALQWSGMGLGLLCLAGIFHTGFAYTLYFESVQDLPAQTVALMSYIDPVLAILLSAWILHEALSPLAMIGIVMVLGSAVSSEVSFKNRKKYK
ncbi:DMT family transporter [Peptoniphilus equinus]|uniref:DMT family transporter n=1 Tax=Peptoniphilus equinus TaxID=3016343 RepID=A0ABY7QRD4_9FIRM|nr:DMT family transporter [Peptoniphilus equinus]WBW49353.1 DMT family transporter [Peptoniphilus equinus]